MQNFNPAWQVLSNVARSCALNGFGVAMVTLVILAWNNGVDLLEKQKERIYVEG